MHRLGLSLVFIFFLIPTLSHACKFIQQSTTAQTPESRALEQRKATEVNGFHVISRSTNTDLPATYAMIIQPVGEVDVARLGYIGLRTIANRMRKNGATIVRAGLNRDLRRGYVLFQRGDILWNELSFGEFRELTGADEMPVFFPLDGKRGLKDLRFALTATSELLDSHVEYQRQLHPQQREFSPEKYIPSSGQDSFKKPVVLRFVSEAQRDEALHLIRHRLGRPDKFRNILMTAEPLDYHSSYGTHPFILVNFYNEIFFAQVLRELALDTVHRILPGIPADIRSIPRRSVSHSY